MSRALLAAAALAVAATTAMIGCYQDYEPAPQAVQTPPQPQQAKAASQRPSAGIENTPRPSLFGAKRAAQNTVDRIEQHQQELKKAMDDE